MPTNRRKRADRIQEWNASWNAGQNFDRTRAAGKDARYKWITAVIASDLASTTRHVALTLVTHGLSNGKNIFPGIRTLCDETKLCAKTVCDHLDILVRRGFLMRQPRGEGSAGARGFIYILFIPAVLEDVQHSVVAASVSVVAASDPVLEQLQRSSP